MSTVLQEAMDRAKAAQQTQKTGKKGAISDLDVNQILERLKVVTALREQAITGKELDESVITAAEQITTEQQRRKTDIAAIEAAVKAGNLLAETGNEFTTALQAEVAEWSQHLRRLMAEYPTLATAIAKRANFNARVTQLGAKLAGFMVGETKIDEIKGLIAEAERSGVIKHAPQGPITIGFGRMAVSYGPVSEDPAVQKFSTDFAAFMQKFTAKGDEIRSSRRSEVEEFLLTKPQIETLKNHEGTVKSLLGFFGGQGQYVFVPVMRPDIRSSKEWFEGEVLLERRSGKMWAVKATSERLAHSVFGWFDKKAGGVWKKNGKQAVTALKKDEGGGYDLDGIRNNTLREALQAKLAKDAAWQKTRDTAAKLRDVSSVQGPVITMAELFREDKGTCVANVRLRAGEKHVWATMHVVSNGVEARISAYAPDDLMNVAPWLGTYTEPKDLAMFRQDKQWQYLAAENRDYFEADWLYAKEVEKRGAAALTEKNVDGLCSADSGMDGLYGIRSTFGNRRTPLRFIMERKGNEVAVVWTAPGTSWRLMHDSAGESLIGKFYPVADMPKPVRDTLRNQYRYFHGLGGDAGLQQVPEYLKSSPDATCADEESEAGNGDDE